MERLNVAISCVLILFLATQTGKCSLNSYFSIFCYRRHICFSKLHRVLHLLVERRPAMPGPAEERHQQANVQAGVLDANQRLGRGHLQQLRQHLRREGRLRDTNEVLEASH